MGSHLVLLGHAPQKQVADFLLTLVPVIFDLIEDDEEEIREGEGEGGEAKDDGKRRRRRRRNASVEEMGVWKELSSMESCFQDAVGAAPAAKGQHEARNEDGDLTGDWRNLLLL